jgi:hypothetical protein
MKTGRFKLLVLLDLLTFIASVAYSQTTTPSFSVTTGDATAITATSAELHGTINPGGGSSAAWFEWGTTSSLGTRSETRLVGDGTTTINISQLIGNLQPRTTYYFRLVGYHAAGNVPGDTHTFTTTGDGPTTTTTTNNTAPLTVTTGDAGDVTANSATLGGSVNPGGTAMAWFDWGTTAALGNRTDSQTVTGTTAQPLTAALGNLQPHTTYYFRATAYRSSDGRGALGEVHTFTTAGTTTGEAPTNNTNEPLTVVTNNASDVTDNSCVLNGSINFGGGTMGAAWFEWGISTALGNRTETRIFSTGGNETFSFLLRNLQPGMTYYFRAVGYRSGGTNAMGEILTCTTNRVASTKPETTEVEHGDIRSGYVVITPDTGSGAPTPTMTFGMISGGSVQSQAGIIPTPTTTDASMFIEVIPKISRNIGVAITNPGSTPGAVNLTLRDENGIVIGSPANVLIAPHQQVAKFVNELFGADTIGAGFRGSLRIQSSTPFSVVGLRFSGYIFSTLPVAVTAGGGSNVIILPQFALAGGWATQIALVNNTTATISGRIDLFDTAGNPLAANLNGETKSSFTYSIPVGGTFVLAPRDSNGQSPF